MRRNAPNGRPNQRRELAAHHILPRAAWKARRNGKSRRATAQNALATLKLSAIGFAHKVYVHFAGHPTYVEQPSSPVCSILPNAFS